MSQKTNLNAIFFTNFENAQRNKNTLFKEVIRGIMEPANDIISYVVKKIDEKASDETHTSNDDIFNINIMEYVTEQQRKLKQENENILEYQYFNERIFIAINKMIGYCILTEFIKSVISKLNEIKENMKNGSNEYQFFGYK